MGSKTLLLKNYFLDFKKSVEKDIYETKIKDINHYAYYLKYFDNEEKLKKTCNITYGYHDKYHNYEPVNELELLDVRIPEDRKNLISRDWY